MSAVLVYVQHNEGKVSKASLVAITAAKELLKAWQGSALVGVAVGPGAAAAAAEVGVYGLSQVATIEGSDYQAFRAVPYSAAVQAAVAKFQAATVVFASTSVGKDIAPRIAADLNAGQATDIVAVHPDGSLRRPMYAGNAFADVEVVTPVRVVTVRTTAFAAAVAASGSATVVPLQVSFDPAIAGEFVSAEISKGGRPELSDAAMVVSGGRALQSAENFEKVLFPLADALGAAVGASRAAVDSGYAPNDWQVGQTGKVVAPSLYIACGISGAIQHLAGMKDSKTIVAINKDPEAPIFEVADFGLVADLFQAVPELTAAVRTLKGGA